MSNWKALPTVATCKLLGAAMTQRVHCSAWKGHNLLLGDSVDTCLAILRVADQVCTTDVLIDSGLYDELQYSFHCRIVNILALHPKSAAERLVSVYELQAEKVQCGLDGKDKGQTLWGKGLQKDYEPKTLVIFGSSGWYCAKREV